MGGADYFIYFKSFQGPSTVRYNEVSPYEVFSSKISACGLLKQPDGLPHLVCSDQGTSWQLPWVLLRCSSLFLPWVCVRSQTPGIRPQLQCVLMPIFQMFDSHNTLSSPGWLRWGHVPASADPVSSPSSPAREGKRLDIRRPHFLNAVQNPVHRLEALYSLQAQ